MCIFNATFAWLSDHRKSTLFSNEPRTPYGMRFMFTNVSGKLKSIKGQLTINFEPTKKLYLTQKFCNYFTYKQLKPIDRLGQTKDLKIVCEDEEFTFNQNILCNVSKVFQRMLENPTTNEASNCNLKIQEFLPQTIKTFRVCSSHLEMYICTFWKKLYNF